MQIQNQDLEGKALITTRRFSDTASSRPVPVNGITVRADDELWDGSSEDCLIDTSAWTAGDNIVTVMAIGGTNGDFSMGATTSTWL